MVHTQGLVVSSFLPTFGSHIPPEDLSDSPRFSGAFLLKKRLIHVNQSDLGPPGLEPGTYGL